MVAREINALTQPITELKGVGNKIAERLHKLGIKQIQDLLFHLPLRYQDRTQLLPMGSLISGKEGLVEGAIRLSQVTFGRRRTLLCYLDDDTGSIVLRFFHFSKVQQQQLSEGVRVRCFGEIRKGPSSLEMVHPCPPHGMSDPSGAGHSFGAGQSVGQHVAAANASAGPSTPRPYVVCACSTTATDACH